MGLPGDDLRFIESRKCLSLKVKNRWSCNRSLEQSFEAVQVSGVCDSNDDLNHHRSEDPLPRHYSIKRLIYATWFWGCSQCLLFSYRQKYKNHRAHSFLRPTDSPKFLIAWLSPAVPTFLLLNFLNSSSLRSRLKGLSTSKKVLYLTAFSVGKTFLQPPDLNTKKYTFFILIKTTLEQASPIYCNHFSFIWHSFYFDWACMIYPLQTVDLEVLHPSL